MMKRLFDCFACCCRCRCRAAATYVEGRHYAELALPQAVETGNKIEVREFFWYGCPHCYDLEPAIEAWLKKLPRQGAVRAHARRRSPLAGPRARVLRVRGARRVREKTHVAFFKALHVQKRPLEDEPSLLGFAAANGVDKEKFRQAFNSFGVRLKLDKARQLNLEMGIHSVPTLVVDGKYLTTPVMPGGNGNVQGGRVSDPEGRPRAQVAREKPQ